VVVEGGAVRGENLAKGELTREGIKATRNPRMVGRSERSDLRQAEERKTLRKRKLGHATSGVRARLLKVAMGKKKKASRILSEHAHSEYLPETSKGSRLGGSYGGNVDQREMRGRKGCAYEERSFLKDRLLQRAGMEGHGRILGRRRLSTKKKRKRSEHCNISRKKRVGEEAWASRETRGEG